MMQNFDMVIAIDSVKKNGWENLTCTDKKFVRSFSYPTFVPYSSYYLLIFSLCGDIKYFLFVITCRS